MENDWKIFTGKSTSDTQIDLMSKLPPPPPWRDFAARDKAPANVENDPRGTTYQATEDEIEMVNAALYLRRPLLVTGNPGTGKSSLAYAIAHELNLGKVLRWSISSKSTLNEGLYQYDAISRLRETGTNDGNGKKGAAEDIGQYLKLGPLGTALYPMDRPRVLLIDEIDKSDIDLPNDLLHVFEEGEYEIPEVARAVATFGDVSMSPLGAEPNEKVLFPASWAGRVRCRAFPFVLLTSNGEREMPPAFFRRCLRLRIEDPKKKRLEAIVAAHLGELPPASKMKVDAMIDDFLKRQTERQTSGSVATDQLLNTIYLVTKGKTPPEGERQLNYFDALLKGLGQS